MSAILERVGSLSFGPHDGGSGTSASWPLMRGSRVVVGSFCFDREEWYGLFVGDVAQQTLRGARVPRDLVTPSLDSFLQPIACDERRVIAAVQYQSVVPTVGDSGALVIYDAGANSWRKWRSSARAVFGSGGGLVAWLASNAIEMLDTESETLQAVVPLSTNQRVDAVACDRKGTHVAYASKHSVSCLRRDGRLIASWQLPAACWKLRVAEDGLELFALLRGGGLARLEPSGGIVDCSRPSANCAEVDPVERQGYFVEPGGQLRKTDLQEGTTIAVGAISERNDFIVDVDTATGTVAAIDRFEQTVRVFRFS